MADPNFATDSTIKKLSLEIDESGQLPDLGQSIDPAAERSLVWKFDLRILPVLAVMYLFNSLDKSNLGNAKTAGLEETLNLKGNQYNLILSIFFIPYVLTAPFLGIAGKIYGPNRVLPCMMLSFGLCTLLVVAVFDFGGLFGNSVVSWDGREFYRRGELARRLAIFYAGQSIASAFSGLLSFGVFRIKSGPLASWRYLFLIEGGGTILFAVFAFWYLPRSSTQASFLSDEEKSLAYTRMQLDSSAVVDEKINIRESLAIFKHGTSWAVLAIQICLGVPLQSVQLFLPVIISRLGYDTVKTNLYTVAPNVSGAAMLLILAFCSDWTRWRFPFVALGFLFTFIGMVIYVAIDVERDINVAYFASFMMTWGTSAPSVLLDVWYNNNIASEGKRVVLTSIAVPLANLMGLVSSNIFRAQDAPKYIPALITTAAFGGTGMILTVLLGAWMVYDNKRRDAAQGVVLRAKDIPTEHLKAGPESPTFRWFY
ncbi:major facilitator superfamily domain-containing protein [Aspergillus pseudoustus]|uniref:Major facilitator superfamily domain-containing protein n=1 Tax=Aspergillus pseudoustus TaxID=1810923 RepID=A0ABR4J586_9EURO